MNAHMSNVADAKFLAAIEGQFALEKLLGKGAYGSVFKAVALEGNCLNVEPGSVVAIKVILNVLHGYNAINAKRMLREICILRNLDDPNIIRFRGMLPPHDINTLRDLYIVFDYVVTDLYKILHSDQSISNKHVQYIAYQIIKSLRYLHDRDIIHRDIKPANLLIDERVMLKLCDFGLARSTTSSHRLRSLISGDSPKNDAVENQSSQTNQPQSQPQPPSSPAPASARPNSLLPPRPPRAPGSTKPPLQRTPSEITALHSHPTIVNGIVSTSNPNGQNAAGSAGGQRPQLQREFTLHVATRWYRAPELIIHALNRNVRNHEYTPAIDMWAVGCILAELIGMQLNNPSRAALFPGDSCYPLSPLNPNRRVRNPTDQLISIFQVIGTPSPETVTRIFPRDSQISQYFAQMPIMQRENLLDTKYPGADPVGIDLLMELIQFDPQKRLTAREALRHPYFNEIVSELKEAGEVYGFTIDEETGERREVEPSIPAIPPFFDFEEDVFNIETARALLVEQVLIDNRNLCEKYVVTREFQAIMERRETRIRDEYNIIRQENGRHHRDVPLTDVSTMKAMEQNTECLENLLQAMPATRNLSHFFFPPHNFKSVEAVVDVFGMNDDDRDAFDTPLPVSQSTPGIPSSAQNTYPTQTATPGDQSQKSVCTSEADNVAQAPLSAIAGAPVSMPGFDRSDSVAESMYSDSESMMGSEAEFGLAPTKATPIPTYHQNTASIPTNQRPPLPPMNGSASVGTTSSHNNPTGYGSGLGSDDATSRSGSSRSVSVPVPIARRINSWRDLSQESVVQSTEAAEKLKSLGPYVPSQANTSSSSMNQVVGSPARPYSGASSSSGAGFIGAYPSRPPGIPRPPIRNMLPPRNPSGPPLPSMSSNVYSGRPPLANSGSATPPMMPRQTPTKPPGMNNGYQNTSLNNLPGTNRVGASPGYSSPYSQQQRPKPSNMSSMPNSNKMQVSSNDNMAFKPIDDQKLVSTPLAFPPESATFMGDSYSDGENIPVTTNAVSSLLSNPSQSGSNRIVRPRAASMALDDDISSVQEEGDRQELEQQLSDFMMNGNNMNYNHQSHASDNSIRPNLSKTMNGFPHGRPSPGLGQSAQAFPQKNRFSDGFASDDAAMRYRDDNDISDNTYDGAYAMDDDDGNDFDLSGSFANDDHDGNDIQDSQAANDDLDAEAEFDDYMYRTLIRSSTGDITEF